MVSKKKAIGVVVGSAFVAGVVLVPMANAADNPFALHSLQSGYMVAEAKATDGKCGQGKCGGMKTQEKPAAPATPTAPKSGEAKCGQGKCGNMKK